MDTSSSVPVSSSLEEKGRELDEEEGTVEMPSSPRTETVTLVVDDSRLQSITLEEGTESTEQDGTTLTPQAEGSDGADGGAEKKEEEEGHGIGGAVEGGSGMEESTVAKPTDPEGKGESSLIELSVDEQNEEAHQSSPDEIQEVTAHPAMETALEKDDLPQHSHELAKASPGEESSMDVVESSVDINAPSIPASDEPAKADQEPVQSSAGPVLDFIPLEVKNQNREEKVETDFESDDDDDEEEEEEDEAYDTVYQDLSKLPVSVQFTDEDLCGPSGRGVCSRGVTVPSAKMRGDLQTVDPEADTVSGIVGVEYEAESEGAEPLEGSGKDGEEKVEEEEEKEEEEEEEEEEEKKRDALKSDQLDTEKKREDSPQPIFCGEFLPQFLPSTRTEQQPPFSDSPPASSRGKKPSKKTPKKRQERRPKQSKEGPATPKKPELSAAPLTNTGSEDTQPLESSKPPEIIVPADIDYFASKVSLSKYSKAASEKTSKRRMRRKKRKGAVDFDYPTAHSITAAVRNTPSVTIVNLSQEEPDPITTPAAPGSAGKTKKVARKAHTLSRPSLTQRDPLSAGTTPSPAGGEEESVPDPAQSHGRRSLAVQSRKQRPRKRKAPSAELLTELASGRAQCEGISPPTLKKPKRQSSSPTWTVSPEQSGQAKGALRKKGRLV